jgi:crotonobetainyl-CoA:carnitine CoA-transferase CaiB-like acyl-CoA transferase
MVMSNLYMNIKDGIAYPGKPPRRPADAAQFGTSATRRLYHTAPREKSLGLAPWDDPQSRWIFLSAESDADFARFCAAAGGSDLASEPQFATRAGRAEHDARCSRPR